MQCDLWCKYQMQLMMMMMMMMMILVVASNYRCGPWVNHQPSDDIIMIIIISNILLIVGCTSGWDGLNRN